MSPLDKSSVHLPNVFSPLAKTLLDAFSEGVVVFDHDGKAIYVNEVARDSLPDGFDLSPLRRGAAAGTGRNGWASPAASGR